MWDPACAADAMEMSFQGFDSETLISSLDASQMSLPSKFEQDRRDYSVT